MEGVTIPTLVIFVFNFWVGVFVVVFTLYLGMLILTQIFAFLFRGSYYPRIFLIKETEALRKKLRKWLL